MSSTLLRLGLTVVLLAVTAWVAHETVLASSEFLDPAMLMKALVLGAALVGAGFVTRLFERTAGKAIKQNRCAVCRAPIPPRAIYCRAHLRRVLHEEEDRSHLRR